MCVIAGSPLGVPRPSDTTMEAMFNSNPDGAGFAYTMNDRVYVEKGFMSYKEFENALAGLEKRLKKDNLTCTDIPIFFHFRIGTHGANIPSLTHPFPISNNIKNLFAIDYSTDVVMAHNGIINTVSVTGAHSDTTEYISRILVPLRNADSEFYKNSHFQELMINTIDGSRFIFLDNNNEMVTIGNWMTSEEEPGVLFSNLNHEWSFNLSSKKYSRFPVDYYEGYRSSSFTDLATVKLIPDGFYLTSEDNIQQVLQGTNEYPAGMYLVNQTMHESTNDAPYDFYIEKHYNGLVIDLERNGVGEYLYDLSVVYKLIDEEQGLIEIVKFEDIEGKVSTMEVGY
jgi:predicted glutamine amidotransferase